MTVLEAKKTLAVKLTELYDHREATNIADMVIEKITGLTKTQRLISKRLELSVEEQELIENFTAELLTSKPVQYVLHEAWFGGLKFYVDENVLIPRPETEELVNAVIKSSSNKNYSILDIGTGSGCIAITLSKKLPTSNVYALDISDKSIFIAKENADKNKVEVNFIQADILDFDASIKLPVFDILVSNPPYIKQSESEAMSRNVLKYEPHLALFVADEDPLLFYRAIADFALQHLKRNSGQLFFEINETMGNEVSALLKEKGFSEVSVQKDLQGKDRIVYAVLR
jgi:release factor glutamine methyltransferase